MSKRDTRKEVKLSRQHRKDYKEQQLATNPAYRDAKKSKWAAIGGVLGSTTDIISSLGTGGLSQKVKGIFNKESNNANSFMSGNLLDKAKQVLNTNNEHLTSAAPKQTNTLNGDNKKILVLGAVAVGIIFLIKGK